MKVIILKYSVHLIPPLKNQANTSLLCQKNLFLPQEHRQPSICCMQRLVLYKDTKVLTFCNIIMSLEEE